MAAEKISSISRVLDIMECFGLNKTEYTLSELAKELSLPMSTVHRQLNTLVARGYVQQSKETKAYRTGSRMILLGCSIVSHIDLRHVARPFLQKLSDMVEETVHLCMLDGLNMFYVDKIECLRSVSCISRVGGRLPAHATAAGKMLLAGQPEEVIDDYCRALPGMPVFTKKTITDPLILRDSLSAIRKQGYSLDIEEIEEGLICVSAPLLTYDHNLNTAVSVSGPIFRMEGQLDHFVTQVRSTARDISMLMGCDPAPEPLKVYSRPWGRK